MGGDTDTVAACCGAVAGAYTGFEGIVAQGSEENSNTSGGTESESGLSIPPTTYDAAHVLSTIHDSDAPGTADVPALRALAKGLHDVACGGAGGAGGHKL